MSMKMNMKLGGITHQVALPAVIDKQTMIMGADVSNIPKGSSDTQVTHPPARRMGAIQPSIAVTIAATNGDNNVYLPCIRQQEGRVWGFPLYLGVDAKL